MSFTTPEFIVFFCITFLLYFSIPSRFRWLLLLILSYIFYAFWNIGSVPILLASSLLNYFLAKGIFSAKTQRQKNRYLLADIAVNLVVLFVFKYFNFFGDAVARVLNLAHIAYTFQTLNVVLPIGISFYTFQQISYNIDVYRSRLKPENNFGIYAVFVAFFPHITSGPIDRGTSLLPQFRQRTDLKTERVVEGLRLVLWGVFKKTVIADRLGNHINAVYKSPAENSGLPLLLATVFFAFQIYADFSGYTDIASGIAKVLGFKLAINFQQPYLALSIREFWQRWHISLSTWIRDYLFYPMTRKAIRLSGGKYPRATQLVVSMVVMGLVGLWHGASFTFVIWGLLHGLFLGLEALFRNVNVGGLAESINDQVKRLIKLLFTFSLICLTLIFFRANTVTDAFYILTHLFIWNTHFLYGAAQPFNSKLEFLLCFLFIGLLISADLLNSRWNVNELLKHLPGAVRWAIYYAAIFIILQFGIVSGPQFIYLRF